MLTPLIIAAFLASPPAPGTRTEVQDWAAQFPAEAGPMSIADFAEPPAPPKLGPVEAHAIAEALLRDMEQQEKIDKLLSSRRERWIINTAIWCYAVQTLTTSSQADERARRRLVDSAMAAESRLFFLRIQQDLPCDAWPVERLVACLGLLPTAECATDADLALQVAAAEKVAGQ